MQFWWRIFLGPETQVPLDLPPASYVLEEVESKEARAVRY